MHFAYKITLRQIELTGKITSREERGPMRNSPVLLYVQDATRTRRRESFGVLFHVEVVRGISPVPPLTRVENSWVRYMPRYVLAGAVCETLNPRTYIIIAVTAGEPGDEKVNGKYYVNECHTAY